MDRPRDEVAEGLETLLSALDRLSSGFEQLADDLASASAPFANAERTGLVSSQRNTNEQSK